MKGGAMIRRGSFKPHSLSHGLLILALLALVGLPAAAGASRCRRMRRRRIRRRRVRRNLTGRARHNIRSGHGRGLVLAIALQPDGKVLVGGQFAQFNDITHNGIVRLATDGSLDDAYNPSVTGGDYAGVTSIARQPDGKAMIGGAFTEVNGEPRAGIARLKTDGALDTEFDPGAGIADEYEYLDVVKPSSGRQILIGGAFTAFDGAWCGGIDGAHDHRRTRPGLRSRLRHGWRSPRHRRPTGGWQDIDRRQLSPRWATRSTTASPA